MSYIESHQELGRHPKTKRLARLLSVSLPCAVGHLQFLWWWAMDYAQDGDLTKFDAFDIADAAGWEGNPQVFLDALIQCGIGDGAGFVEHDQYGAMWLHDWNQYGGKLFEERRKNAQRVASHRSKQVTEKAPRGEGNDTPPLRNAHVTRTSPVTLKERRGEESIEKPAASTREDAPAADAQPPKTVFDPSKPLPVVVENFLSHMPDPPRWRSWLLDELTGREFHSLERYALGVLREKKQQGGLPPSPPRRSSEAPPQRQRRLTHEEAVLDSRRLLTELLTEGDGFE